MLTTAAILEVFTEEVEAHSGRVTDTFNDGTRLFTRATLPYTHEVKRKDRVQGGVALKAVNAEVWLYPYVYREVCKNGAIMAQSLHGQHLTNLENELPEEAERTLRTAIGVCCVKEAFERSTHDIRSSIDTDVELALLMLPMLSRLPDVGSSSILSLILDEFLAENDRSRFGLMNAVTAVARETPDPETKWNLEEMGGGIAAGLMPDFPVDERNVSLHVPPSTSEAEYDDASVILRDFCHN